MQASFSSPTRAVQTFRPAWLVQGPSALDTSTYVYRQARDACDFTALLARAYADLARANRVLPQHRSARRAAAFRAINAIRAERRAAWAIRDRAEVVLYAAGGNASLVDAADAARSVRDVLPAGCVSLADDPDMQGWSAAS